MQELFLVDASAYLFRAYYAIRHMSNDQGQSTNALYGFIRSIEKLQKDFNPTHLAIVFDGPQNSKSRKEIYADYKANRQSAPEDLPEQMQLAEDYCRLKGFPIIKEPFVEADDSIASIATWASKETSAKVIICSADKDLCQLVKNNVCILHTHKDNTFIDREGVFDLFSVYPEQIVDYLAITGDSSDNIPGFAGFGPKTAAKLLGEFKTLEGLIENVDAVKGKKKQDTIKEQSQQAMMSRRLAQTITDLPIPKTPDFYSIKTTNLDQLALFYETYAFQSLKKELFAATKHQQDVDSPKKQCHYVCIQDESELHALLTTLKTAECIAFDTETNSANALDAELVGIAFSIKAFEAFYIPMRGKISQETILENLKPLFEDPKLRFFGHNVKYDLHVLANYSIHVKTVCFDTILASYLLHADEQRHSLEHLAKKYFNIEKISYKSLLASSKDTLFDVNIDKVCAYCCEDSDICFRLKVKLEEELKERKLEHLLYTIEMPLLHILQEMEAHGIYAQADRLKELAKHMQERISSIEEEIYSLCGERFNLHSSKQLSDILFNKLKLPPSKKNQSGYSTNAQVLEKLALDHPIAEKILFYRSLEKLRSTYTDSLIREINAKTGRIHCSFRQSVAATGRLSCQNPNLQNIPIRSNEGLEIRGAFKAQKDGWSYLSADYSQIELRLLAHMSNDPILIEAFKRDDDIHRQTAASIFSIDLDSVSDKQRSHAKAVNFGILYGQSAFGLARELKISMAEAAKIIKAYFERFPKIQAFIEECKEHARKYSYVETLSGRQRYINDINSKNQHLRAAAERLAVNTPLQGSAADLIKLAMIRCKQEFCHSVGYLILQIHDELIFEIPDFEILNFQQRVKTCMEEIFKLKVPLKVDISVGKTWKDL